MHHKWSVSKIVFNSAIVF